MPPEFPPILAVYLCARLSEAKLWLRSGVPPAPPDAFPSARRGMARAWLTPLVCRSSPAAIHLVAAIAPERALVADCDLGTVASTTHDAVTAARLAAAYDASIVPYPEYRRGRFRRPEVLVPGGIPPDVVAGLSEDVPEIVDENAEEYRRQLHQALRAMIGAPAAASTTDLVAAAVARGRARLVATHADLEQRMLIYAVDGGSWYFTYELPAERKRR